MSITNGELTNFNFFNFVPNERSKQNCIQVSKRINISSNELGSIFFVEKCSYTYKVVGVVTTHLSKRYVFSSSSVNLLTALMTVESGLLKQLSSNFENSISLNSAV